MTTMIVAEKPKAANRIAYSLAENQNNIKKKNRGKAVWYELRIGNEDCLVVPAVGHLFGLEQKGEGWKYPMFETEWAPTYKTDDSAKFTKPYYQNLKKLSKKADEFIIATDYDIEGDVIAYNILRFIFGIEDAERMKFSTLTTSELQESYNDLMGGMDKEQIEAGLTRHKLDWLWGINTSRALTLAVKNSGGGFKVLSSGRVQGPALKILADREKNIQDFEPEPYWEIEAELENDKGKVEAEHEKGKFWEKDEAEGVKDKCESSEVKVDNVKRNKYKWGPFPPFDLTTLQTEAYSSFGISPSKTLDLAQNLYDQGLISYPRTSSQKLPKKLGYKKILKKIKNQGKYEDLAQRILNMNNIYPRQGKKKDEAHPAIHPTGVKPKNLSGNNKKLYDLIVKRFISTFGKPAIRESLKITFDINSEVFTSNGKRVIEKNWIELYQPYVRFKEQKLPDFKEGETLEVLNIEMLEKETKPPKRYTQASLVKKLQKKSLGTKATRSQIVKTLFNRGYIDGKKIKVTELGLSVADTLEKYSPEILSEDLTRKFEKGMGSIREGENDKKNVIEEAEETLKEVFEKFKDKEKKIGKKLSEALKKTRKDKYRVGKCPECGNYLRIIKSKNGKKFVGCEGYKKEGCENTYPLPQYGKIVSTGKVCDTCGTPIIKVIRKGKKPWEMCLDPDCETKDDWNNDDD